MQLRNMPEVSLLFLRKIQNLKKQQGWIGLVRKVGSAFKKRVALLMRFDRNNYERWVRRYDTLDKKDRVAITLKVLDMKPILISVIMPISTPDGEVSFESLRKTIDSVRAQLYPYWELEIVAGPSLSLLFKQEIQQLCQGDARIKLQVDVQAGSIFAAFNRSLRKISGQWVSRLGQQDVLSEHALFLVAQAILANPDAAIIYSDEDKIDAVGGRYEPTFKPDWNPDFFLSCNMIGSLAVYQARLVRQLGDLRSDYDLALHCVEQVKTTQIIHIPKVLYHRRYDDSRKPNILLTAANESAQNQRAITDHFRRTGVDASVDVMDSGIYRVKYGLPLPQPMVSVIIPTRNGLQLIRQCVDSILSKTIYENYEIVIIDNNSDEPATLHYLASLESTERVRILRDPRPFNYSALNNSAVDIALGEYLCLLNNDIEVISPDWLNEMVSFAIQPGVGAVGARLWYPDNTLQHGGVITGMRGVAGHVNRQLSRDSAGYLGRAQSIQSLSAVTAACLVVSKRHYQLVGGLDEKNLSVAFNDIDFCLRLRHAGYRNVWTPYAELYHHESASRGREDTPEKYDRFAQEAQYMLHRWGDELQHDPAYNPNLTLENEDCSLAWPPRCLGYTFETLPTLRSTDASVDPKSD